MIKLYHAWSVVNNFRGYDGVKIKWYCGHRDQPVALYKSVIENYENIAGIKDYAEDSEFYYREMAEDFVDELLTEAEVDELRKHLTGERRDTFQVSEFPLPVSKDCNAYRYYPMGGPVDSYMLHQEQGYDLSIPIVGFYDLEASIYQEVE
jgi:hypothetical protein